MNLCVFLSAADLDDCYTRPAREFAELLGEAEGRAEDAFVVVDALAEQDRVRVARERALHGAQQGVAGKIARRQHEVRNPHLRHALVGADGAPG